mmetsp:Transcript_20375/g.43678  ORF Transcript_20375/g.43678 Transcript_20375/m.43678 type:complete len:456 (+) Transcript_20375:199-1566(+)
MARFISLFFGNHDFRSVEWLASNRRPLYMPYQAAILPATDCGDRVDQPKLGRGSRYRSLKWARSPIVFGIRLEAVRGHKVSDGLGPNVGRHVRQGPSKDGRRRVAAAGPVPKLPNRTLVGIVPDLTSEEGKGHSDQTPPECLLEGFALASTPFFLFRTMLDVRLNYLFPRPPGYYRVAPPESVCVAERAGVINDRSPHHCSCDICSINPFVHVFHRSDAPVGDEFQMRKRLGQPVHHVGSQRGNAAIANGRLPGELPSLVLLSLVIDFSWCASTATVRSASAIAGVRRPKGWPRRSSGLEISQQSQSCVDLQFLNVGILCNCSNECLALEKGLVVRPCPIDLSVVRRRVSDPQPMLHGELHLLPIVITVACIADAHAHPLDAFRDVSRMSHQLAAAGPAHRHGVGGTSTVKIYAVVSHSNSYFRRERESSRISASQLQDDRPAICVMSMITIIIG